LICDRAKWQAWEADYIAHERPDFQKNLELVEALYAHARALGKWQLDDEMESLKIKIEIARVVNVPKASGTNRART